MSKVKVNSRIMILLVVMLLCVALVGGGVQAAKIRMRYWGTSDVGDVDAANEISREFEKKNPNVSIENEYFPKFDVKLYTALATRTGPDVFFVRGLYIQKLIKSNQLLRFTPDAMSKEDYRKDFLSRPAEKDAYIGFDGEYYGVPVTFLPSHFGYFLNLDLLAEAGLAEYPETWEEILQAAAKMTVRDGGMIKQAGFSRTEWGINETIWSLIWQYGGDFFNDESKRFDYTNPKAKAGVNLWVDTILKFSGPEIGSAYEAWMDSRVAMLICQPWLGRYTHMMAPDVRFVFLPLPSAVEGTRYFMRAGTDAIGWAASAETEYPDSALDFLKFIGSPEMTYVYLGYSGEVPLTKAHWDSDYFKTGEGAEWAWVPQKLKEDPDVVRWGSLMGDEWRAANIVEQQMDLVYTKSQTVDEALAAMEKESNEMIIDYYPD